MLIVWSPFSNGRFPTKKLNNKERENLYNTPQVTEDSEDDFELPSINYSTPMSQISMFIC